MTYAVLSCRNGTYHVDAEGFTDIKQAIVKFHDVCKTLWNAEDVQTATVIVSNEQFYPVNGYRDIIDKNIDPEQG